MLKSVLLSVPIYLMSYYKLPVHIIGKLHSILSKFWHGAKVRWDSLDILTIPRAQGGLGLCQLRIFNQTLLSKNGWKLLHDNESLWAAKVFKAKYFPTPSFLEVSMTSRPSYLWSSLIWGRELLQKGLGWQINNRCSVKV